MESILCIIDFDETSVNVLSVALREAAKRQARLTILYSYRLIPDKAYQEISTLRKTIEAKAKAEFTKLEKKILKDSNTPYEFLIEIGFVSDRIKMLLKRGSGQMIVMSHSLANDINKHRDLTFDDFLNEVAVPVVLVPKRPDESLFIGV